VVGGLDDAVRRAALARDVEIDDALNRLAQRDGYLKGVWSASR